MCYCGNCDILHVRSSGVTYTAAVGAVPSNLTITIPNVTLTNGQVFELSINQPLPAFTGDNPMVEVTDGSSTYPVYLKMGNFVRGISIKGINKLLLVYGSDPVHLTVISPHLKSY